MQTSKRSKAKPRRVLEVNEYESKHKGKDCPTPLSYQSQRTIGTRGPLLLMQGGFSLRLSLGEMSRNGVDGWLPLYRTSGVWAEPTVRTILISVRSRYRAACVSRRQCRGMRQSCCFLYSLVCSTDSLPRLVRLHSHVVLLTLSALGCDSDVNGEQNVYV